jgi:uracil-DNA glycosylase
LDAPIDWFFLFRLAKKERTKEKGEAPLPNSCPLMTGAKNGIFTWQVESGRELNEAYLIPLGLKRNQCWLTNLVKVFVFKEGHTKKYRHLDCTWPPRPNRDDFEHYAHKSKDWLAEELEAARPRAIITLGTEVAGVLQEVRGQKKRNALLGGDVKPLSIAGKEYPAIHLAHPGITMRKATDRNPWPRLHREKHIPAAHQHIADILPG